ncbi:oryzain alpha chain-like [Phragmites australis]|uniref:oryzain alpha chain-like n=1 Tax=Phragmites australis TaxID=29695 RepID=UPI002D76B2F5|nr:oryzain alpha chain-like [Phragmites australis]
MDNAFRLIIKNGGIDRKADYPFTSHDKRCDLTRQKNAKVVSINNERALQKMVAHQPVSAAIEASGVLRQPPLLDAHNAEADAGLHGFRLGLITPFADFTLEEFRRGRLGFRRNAAAARVVSSIDVFTGKCGIAIEPSYPVKDGPNPPNPGSSPPSPSVDSPMMVKALPRTPATYTGVREGAAAGEITVLELVHAQAGRRPLGLAVGSEIASYHLCCSEL